MVKKQGKGKIECVGFTCKISIILILVSNTMTSFVTEVEYFSDCVSEPFEALFELALFVLLLVPFLFSLGLFLFAFNALRSLVEL